jgi:hypothetical protein
MPRWSLVLRARQPTVSSLCRPGREAFLLLDCIEDRATRSTHGRDAVEAQPYNLSKLSSIVNPLSRILGRSRVGNILSFTRTADLLARFTSSQLQASHGNRGGDTTHQ